MSFDLVLDNDNSIRVGNGRMRADVQSPQPSMRFQGTQSLRGLRLEPTLPFASPPQCIGRSGAGSARAGCNRSRIPLGSVLFGAAPPPIVPICDDEEGGYTGDHETDGLLKVERERRNYERKIAKNAQVVTCTLVTAMGLFVTILLFTCYIGWRVNNNVTYYSEMVTPYVSDMATDAHTIVHSGATMATSTNHLVQTSVPEMMASVNRTSALVQEMYNLAQHPVLQIALGSGTKGG